jgi:hypothetical protein
VDIKNREKHWKEEVDGVGEGWRAKIGVQRQRLGTE